MFCPESGRRPAALGELTSFADAPGAGNQTSSRGNPMKSSRSMLLAIALTISLPVAAHAGVYNIHLGGMCSTNFVEGNGSGRLGTWPGETSINASVDQRDSMAAATVQLAQLLDTYCLG